MTPGKQSLYRCPMENNKYHVKQTDTYNKWLHKVKDRQAVIAILSRVARIAEDGNFGNYKMLGGGLSELKIDVGKGYRVYYTIRDKQVVLLLAGGDKSTQQADIDAARELMKQIETE